MTKWIKKDDEVIVIAGDDKGVAGKIMSVNRKKNRVIVKGVNLVKRHLKNDQDGKGGGIIEKELSIHLSNIKVKTG